VGNIKIVCAAAPTAVASNFAVAFTPTTTKVTLGAGSSTGANEGTEAGSVGTVTLCTTTAPTNTSTFACPTLDSTSIFVSAPTAVVTNNIISFNFTPAAAVQTFYINNIRVNAASSALPSGGAMTAAVTAGGSGGFLGTSSSVVLAFVTSEFGGGSGVTQGNALALPLVIPGCGPVAPPLGIPTSTLGVPTGSGVANELLVTLVEGFLQAFQAAAHSDGGVAGTQGVRFMVTLTGVPAGMYVYAPEVVSHAGAGAGGTVINGANASVFTLVTGTAADGSGVGTAGGINNLANDFDLIPAVGGVVTIVYEVTAPSTGTEETATIFLAITGTPGLPLGNINGSLSVGPIGPPTVNASIPQFQAGTSSVYINVTICATYLLFPWVATDTKGGIDTGIAIVNTTSDPLGTTHQAGSVTLNFYPSGGGTAPAPVALSSSLPSGQAATFVLSSLGTPFTGYIIAVCNFQFAHAFAFINDPAGGLSGWTEGYLADVLPVTAGVRTGGAPPAGVESVGQ